MDRRVATLARVGIGTVALLMAPLVRPAAAQERPGPAVELEAGWIGFADDGIVSELPIGGAVRYYLSRRVSIGPEIVWILGETHTHFIVTGNVTWDLRAPTNGRPPTVTPYLVVGGGLYQTREQLFSGPDTSSEGAYTAGGGLRVLVEDRVTVGIDARMGWEPHIRLVGLVSVQLGR